MSARLYTWKIEGLEAMASILIIWFVLFDLAAFLIVFGWRGKLLDKHPVCRACGYDLFGLPEEQSHCPECGADIQVKNAIRIGNRRRRKKTFAIGLLLEIICIAIPLVGIYHTDFTKYKPYVLLKYEMKQGSSIAGNELLRRATKRKLSKSQLSELVDYALAVYAKNPSVMQTNYLSGFYYAYQKQNGLTEKQYLTLFQNCMKFTAEFNITTLDPTSVRAGTTVKITQPFPWFGNPTLQPPLHLVRKAKTILIDGNNISASTPRLISAFAGLSTIMISTGSGSSTITTDKQCCLPEHALTPGTHKIELPDYQITVTDASTGKTLATWTETLTATYEVTGQLSSSDSRN